MTPSPSKRENDPILDRLDELDVTLNEAVKILEHTAEAGPKLELLSEATKDIRDSVGFLDAAIRGDGTPNNLGILSRLNSLEVYRKAQEEDNRANWEARLAIALAILSAVVTIAMTAWTIYHGK